ncbi:hypothetical protein OC835_001315 [Tilletia horrida]|nr:hypothetical protein OC835_001315 [Tilletia horrida]
MATSQSRSSGSGSGGGSSSSSSNAFAGGKLHVQVELFCPYHQPAKSEPRRLPVFKTRIVSARDARRGIVDTLKRHIPALRQFETLRVSFQPLGTLAPAPATKDGSPPHPNKAAFEAAIIQAVTSSTPLTLKVLPIQGSSKSTKAVCYCGAPPAATAGETSGQKAAPLAQPTAPKPTSSVAAATAAVPVVVPKDSTADLQERLAEADKAKNDLAKENTDLNVRLAESAAKRDSILARLAELEAQHKSLKAEYEKVQKKKAPAQATQPTAAATTSKGTTSHFAPRWQSFCNDLITNLNSSMSSNFGEEAGSFSFQPARSSSTPKPETATPAQSCCTHQVACQAARNAAPAFKPRTSPSARLVGPEIMPGNGASFYCDICKRFCRTEDRFRCLRCPDWDACSSCALYGLGEHAHSNFAFIPAKKETALPKEFSQQCSRCTVTPRDGVLFQYASISRRVKKALCADCFHEANPAGFARIQPAQWAPILDDAVVTSGSRLAHSRPANEGEVCRATWFNATYGCDLCDKDISEDSHRYRCATCKDFDVCTACFDSCKTDLHAHAGYIEYPPASPVPRKSMTSTTAQAVKKEAPVIHGATCDLCNFTIVGTRLKCLDCPDFDVCSKPGCVGLIPTEHRAHRFVRVEDPNAMRQYGTIGPYERGIRGSGRFSCDGCDKTISGTRYACLACPDLDLCANCEALPHKDPAASSVVHTKMTAVSHRIAHGVQHVFVKIPEMPVEMCSGPVPLSKSPSFLQKEKSIQQVIQQARGSVQSFVTQKKDELNLKNDREFPAAFYPVPTPPPTYVHQVEDAQKALAADPWTAMRPICGFAAAAAAAAKDTASAAQAYSAPPSPTAHTDKEAKAGQDDKRSSCTVVHCNEPPKNERLSFEEKRTLSRRVEKGGEAAVKAFLSVLTAEQMNQVNPDGDLVFELDDLSVDQFYNVMTELDALEASARMSVPMEGPYPAPVREAETKAKREVESELSQMSELSTSLKTIRAQASFSSDRSPAASSKAATPEVEDKRLDLDGEFVEDVSLPDGTVVASGSRFDKVWLLRNSGKQAWPADVRLRFVAGDAMGLPISAGQTVPNVSASPPMAGLLPNQTCQVRLSALQAMDVTGRSTSYFRLVAPNKLGHDVVFGHQLWVDVACVSSTDAEASFSQGALAQADQSTAAPDERSDKKDHPNAGAEQEAGTHSNSNSTGRLGGSSVFTAPHAPESVRSDAGASATGSTQHGSGGYRLSGADMDSDDEAENEASSQVSQDQAAAARSPFEDAPLNDSDDEGDEEVFDDSDFELVDPTTEESDME